MLFRSPQDLTGMGVSGVARNRYDVDVNLAGNVTLLAATSGKVRLLPDAADFASTDSPYTLRFAVADSTATNGTARTAYWPSEEPVLVIVRP